MTRSVIVMNITPPKGDEPIPHWHKRNAAEKAIFTANDVLSREFKASGLTHEQVAKRLGWPVNKVRQGLDGPSTMTLSTLGRLLYAITGKTIADVTLRP